MIDLHAHILPGIDDGPKTLEDSLEMARLAVADGIATMVATPHLFRHKSVNHKDLNAAEDIFRAVEDFKQRLSEAEIDLTILPGCEIPLFGDIIKFMDSDRLVTINDGRRYICLELPDSIIPPATDDIIFELSSWGLTPIITHPERNPVLYESPSKLRRFISLGCLAQITARSLTRGFGWRVYWFTKRLIRDGLVHLMATDAHNLNSRPPVMGKALQKLSKLVGESQAWDMVATFPERIIHGQPMF